MTQGADQQLEESLLGVVDLAGQGWKEPRKPELVRIWGLLDLVARNPEARLTLGRSRRR